MNRNSLSILLIIVTTHFLLPKTSLCEVDPKFEACVPKTCGDDQNISFPFWIDGRQEEFCGDPRFRIVCNKNGKPTINLFRDNYTIKNIFYEDQSIRVSAEYLDLISNTCYPPITNLTPLPVGSRFQIDPPYIQLHFYTDCISPLPNYLTSYKVNCSSDNGTTPILAVLGADTDTRLKYVSKECRSTVAMPVEVYKDEKIGGGWEEYNKVMRRGFVLNWTASNCSACTKSGGRCGFDADQYIFRCFCPDGPRDGKCRSPPTGNYKLRKLKLVLGIGCPIILLMCLLFLILWCHYKENSRVFWKKETENHRSVEVFLRNNFSLAPKRYSYSDIKKMTSSFKDKLGQGGYGSVYKGKLHDGRLVAVKLLNKSKGDGEEFLNEVASITKTSHVNIVTLEGFCFQGSKRALIYEFMPNGSLEKFIHDKNPLRGSQQLGWETLYQIAVGIARGLEYLHRGCNTRILHFDIKPHNILLDENFCPKISDFGLAKLCPERGSIISMMGARGTAGYIAPEVFFRNIGGVSHKSDVYSYGMMVLEMVGGRKNIEDGVEHTSEIYFPHWIYRHIQQGGELGQQRVKNEEEDEKAKKMILVGLWCIQTDPSNRPSMARVVEMLHGSLGCLQIPPKPFLFSPSRTSVNSSTSSIMICKSDD